MPKITRVKGVPWLDRSIEQATGRTFFVDSNNGSDSAGQYSGTIEAPFATWDYGYNRCTANNGDVVVLMENHAESIAASGGVTMDTAGVKTIGLGVGSNRPTITFATAAAADIDVSAADNTIQNIIGVCNIANQVAMIDVAATGDGLVVKDCEFREGSATGLAFIRLADADDVIIDNCRFFAPTAGNYDECIEINAALDRLQITNCVAFGDFDEACIQNPTSAIATRILIQGNTLENTQASQHAIQLVSACTGFIVDNNLAGTAAGIILDPGSCKCFNNVEVSGIDEPSLPSPLGDSYPTLGVKVVKSAADPTAAADDIFGVTGKSLVTLVHGEVTTAIAGGSTPTTKLNMKTNSVDLCAATTITTDVVNTLYVLTGDQDDAANGGDAPSVDHAQMGDANGWLPMIVDGDTIEQTTTGTPTAGAIEWTLYYIPLEAGAYIAASA